MKTRLLPFLLLLLPTGAYAQRNSNFNYSIGVKAYSYAQMPKIFNQAEDAYTRAAFHSYFVKFNDNLFSYRLNGSYLKKEVQFNNNCDNCDLATGEMKDLAFKAGFEKNFNYNMIQPYLAFDLGYRSNRFEGVSADNNPSTAMNARQPSTAIIGTKEGLTLSPVLGLKVNPVAEVSLFIESSLDLFYAYERQESVIQDASRTRSISKFRKTEYLINPISVGIQVHFGNKN